MMVVKLKLNSYRGLAVATGCEGIELKTYVLAESGCAQAQLLRSHHDWVKGMTKANPNPCTKRAQFFFESTVPERVQKRIYQ